MSFVCWEASERCVSVNDTTRKGIACLFKNKNGQKGCTQRKQRRYKTGKKVGVCSPDSTCK